MSRRGVIVMTSLGTMMIFVTIGSALLIRSLHESQISTISRDSQGALFLAEASVDRAIMGLRNGCDDNGDTLCDGVDVAAMLNGTYWAEVTPDQGDPLAFMVTGHGLSDAQQRNLAVLAKLIPYSVFQFALFGSASVSIKGDAVTDSYDSRSGSYDPSAAGDDGDVGTNAAYAGAIEISGSIKVNGQIAVGEGVVDPSTVVYIAGGSATITGEPPMVAQTTNLLMPPANPPVGIPCEDRTINAAEVVALPAGEYCFRQLRVQGGGTLTTDGSGQVKIYIVESFTATGNTMIGVESDPSQLLMVLTTASDATITGDLIGSTRFYGGIYSPTGSVDISGNAEIFGSVIARDVEISGNAQIHYDEAVGALTDPVGVYQVGILSWREQ